MTGRVVELSSVEDGVFSSGVLGEGVAIRPTSGRVVAPMAGTVTALPASGHSIGIRGDDGVEVLVHVGLDTVGLDGRPFALHVSQGDRVEAGQHVMDADLEAITAAGLATVTPVVVLDALGATVAFTTDRDVSTGDDLISLTSIKEPAHGTV
jgi:PTS system beta-glucosides-specific IIC component